MGLGLLHLFYCHSLTILTFTCVAVLSVNETFRKFAHNNIYICIKLLSFTVYVHLTCILHKILCTSDLTSHLMTLALTDNESRICYYLDRPFLLAFSWLCLLVELIYHHSLFIFSDFHIHDVCFFSNHVFLQRPNIPANLRPMLRRFLLKVC